MIEKIISGGQTGADRIGLEVAKVLGIPTGGTASKFYRTEIGEDPSLKEFGLVESKSWGYTDRTFENVKNSDMTVLFGDMKSPGSVNTIHFCIHQAKPYVENPWPDELVAHLIKNKVKVLNVAGNRGSKLSQEKKNSIAQILTTALQNYQSYSAIGWWPYSDYDKLEYDIKLEDGTIYENCYPNANQFLVMGNSPIIPGEKVKYIRLSTNPKLGINP